MNTVKDIATFITLAIASSLLLSAEEPEHLVAGKFGLALNAKESRPAAAFQEAYGQPPLTVECWALLRNPDELLVGNPIFNYW
jgi:hypothetical protein